MLDKIGFEITDARRAGFLTFQFRKFSLVISNCVVQLSLDKKASRFLTFFQYSGTRINAPFATTRLVKENLNTKV